MSGARRDEVSPAIPIEERLRLVRGLWEDRRVASRLARIRPRRTAGAGGGDVCRAGRSDGRRLELAHARSAAARRGGAPRDAVRPRGRRAVRHRTGRRRTGVERGGCRLLRSRGAAGRPPACSTARSARRVSDAAHRFRVGRRLDRVGRIRLRARAARHVDRRGESVPRTAAFLRCRRADAGTARADRAVRHGGIFGGGRPVSGAARIRPVRRISGSGIALRRREHDRRRTRHRRGTDGAGQNRDRARADGLRATRRNRVGSLRRAPDAGDGQRAVRPHPHVRRPRPVARLGSGADAGARRTRLLRRLPRSGRPLTPATVRAPRFVHRRRCSAVRTRRAVVDAGVQAGAASSGRPGDRRSGAAGCDGRQARVRAAVRAGSQSRRDRRGAQLRRVHGRPARPAARMVRRVGYDRRPAIGDAVSAGTRSIAKCLRRSDRAIRPRPKRLSADAARSSGRTGPRDVRRHS